VTTLTYFEKLFPAAAEFTCRLFFSFIAMQRKFHLCIPFLGIARPQSQLPRSIVHVSESDLYIPRICPHISCSIIGRSIVGIYKWLTDTCMWKSGLWPRNSFSGNNLFQIFGIGSLQCGRFSQGFGTIFNITGGFRNYFVVIDGYLEAVTTLSKRISIRVFRIST
jgi:hypothetical protein